jgi:hypothetical protein
MELETRTYTRGGGWASPLPQQMDSAKTLVLAFGAADYVDAPAPLEELRAAFPQARILGCSTSGEIAGSRVMDGSLSAAVVRFERSDVATAAAAVAAPEESFAAGASLAYQLNHPVSGQSLRSVLVLSDGLAVNGSELVRGLNSSLPADVVVTGGLAGDGDRFKRTWVLHGGRPMSGFVTAVGLYGPKLQIGHGSRGGWDIFGPERVVTRSKGNVLYELDGQPALKLYKEYLGDRAAGLPATALLFPLSIWAAKSGDARRLVRTILAVDEAAQSLVFAGDLPEGHRAQLMRANLDRLIDGAAAAADMAEGSHAAPVTGPELSIAISCVGRRLILGERTEDELEAVMDACGPATRQIGFYSYGEICPQGVGASDLHNQTMTLTTIREAA